MISPTATLKDNGDVPFTATCTLASETIHSGYTVHLHIYSSVFGVTPSKYNVVKVYKCSFLRSPHHRIVSAGTFKSPPTLSSRGPGDAQQRGGPRMRSHVER